MAKAKADVTRPTDGLWRAVSIVGWLFVVLAAALAIANAYRATLLWAMDPAASMVEADLIPGYEAEFWITGPIAIIFLLVYLTGAFLTLRWYVRSTKNAGVMHRGVSTSPGWVVWNFIIPVISLFRPYTMTSELWRSSLRPEGWKRLNDPALLRWWWGAVLISGFVSVIGDMISRRATSAGELLVAAVLASATLALQALAGILFLSIGGPISRRQTALVRANHRPTEATIPGWSA